MNSIRIRQSLHLKGPSGGSTQVTDINYASRNSGVLLESVDLRENGIIRRSEDNGRTYQVVEEWTKEEPLGDGLVLEHSLPAIFCDPENGLVLRVWATNNHKPDIVPWNYAQSPVSRTRRSFIQVSADEGKTWSNPEQIIVQGNEYNEIHYMPGVYYGRNGSAFEGTHIIKTRAGEVLMPFQLPRLFENGEIINPAADPATANPDGAVEWVSGCLLGRWRAEGKGLDWTAGATVTLPWKYSCDGGDEPSLDYLPDGRLLMVLRARTYPHTGQELPGLHYYTLSADEGRTWSEPEPLLYDDGSYAYSPSCLANVFRSSKNGRFYVITNFTDIPPVNCDPRTKLQIAEIDTDTFRIKKVTLTVIRGQDKKVGEPDTIRFSNFRWYDDRETKNIALYLTASENPAGIRGGPYACRYDIQIPE